MAPDENAARLLIREMLHGRSQDAMDRLMVKLVVGGMRPPDIERVAREELAELPDDLREWWDQPCMKCRVGIPHGHGIN